MFSIVVVCRPVQGFLVSSEKQSGLVLGQMNQCVCCATTKLTMKIIIIRSEQLFITYVLYALQFNGRLANGAAPTAIKVHRVASVKSPQLVTMASPKTLQQLSARVALSTRMAAPSVSSLQDRRQDSAGAGSLTNRCCSRVQRRQRRQQTEQRQSEQQQQQQQAERVRMKSSLGCL